MTREKVENMKRQTIAELRNKAIIQLSERSNEPNTNEARKTMNAFYRLCGMDERLLYLENEERTCNSRYTKALAEQRDKAFERVKGYLAPFNATLVYYGCLPTIVETGSNKDLYLRHFYN